MERVVVVCLVLAVVAAIAIAVRERRSADRSQHAVELLRRSAEGLQEQLQSLDEDRSTLLNLPDRAPAQPTSPTRPAAEPSRSAGWLTPTRGALAAVLALVAGVAVLAARRAHRSQRAVQTA